MSKPMAFHNRQDPDVSGDVTHPLAATAHAPAIAGSGVRRLTPRECERLQGFPEIEHEIRILVCKSEAEKTAIAKSAEANSAAPSLGPNAPVAVSVRIDLERQQVQLHSAGRLPWSASIAELASSSHLPIDPDAFARALAHMHDAVGRLVRHGRAASPASIRHSSPALNGSAPVLLCGQEIDELASDAERFTAALASCTKSTTSAHGANSPSFGSTWETLACCVSAAISGFIPDTMRGACSYELSLTTHCGYTFVPYRGKPAADAPRYKALGNSMAVPCMRWLGRRIELVQKLMEAAA